MSKVGIIAGNGSLPSLIINSLIKSGDEIYLAAHKGETDQKLLKKSTKSITIKVGQLKKIISFFRSNSVESVVFAGGITRTKLFTNVWLDSKALSIIARTGGVKDDQLLRAIALEFESQGFKVVSPQSLVPELLVQEGLLTRRDLSDEEIEYGRIGWVAAKKLGELDIGQGVAVCEGIVIALEAVEGTDAMLKRAGGLSRKNPITFVKLPKPQQDRRLDLPSIGLNTIKSMVNVGCSALILEHHGAILIDPQEAITLANANRIAIRVLKM